MKTLKIVFLLVMTMLMKSSVGQILFEQQYDDLYGFYTVKLESSGHKYVAFDRINDQLSLYNTDYSLFKQISIPAQSNQLYEISYLREKLFDTDSANIEYALEGFYSPGGSLLYVNIYSENGSLLFNKDSVSLYWSLPPSSGSFFQLPIINTDSGTIMILVKDYNPSTYYIYKLPGKLEDECTGNAWTNILNHNIPDKLLFNAFPNPAKGKTTLQYELPKGVKKAELIIYSMSGIEIKRYKVTDSFKRLELDNFNLVAGTYFYQLLLPNGEFGTKKLIVIN